MFAANVWHWWVGVVLLLASVGAVVQTIVLYVVKINSLKYPNRRQRQIQNKK